VLHEREDDDVITFCDDGDGLLVRIHPRSDAALADERDGSGKAEEAH
jgi:hypothetical protein